MAVVDNQGVEFEFQGFIDDVTRTTIGDVPISDVLYNITSALKGKPTIFDICVQYMNSSYVGINSSGHTTGLGNVSITGSGGSGEDKCLLYKDVKIGRAATNLCSFASKPRGTLLQ